MKKSIVMLVAFASCCGMAAFAAEGGDKPKHERKPFEQVDANKDGKISLDEFKGAMPKLDPAKAEEIFKKKDKDADGSLSADEYNAAPKHKKDGEKK